MALLRVAVLLALSGAASAVAVAPAGCVLDPALPANLTQHAAVQPLCAGFLDPTLPPYSAAGDGVHDDSAAVPTPALPTIPEYGGDT